MKHVASLSRFKEMINPFLDNGMSKRKRDQQPFHSPPSSLSPPLPFLESGPRLSSSISFLFYCTATPRCEKAGQSSLQCAWKMQLLHLGYMERFTITKKGRRKDIERCSD